MLQLAPSTHINITLTIVVVSFNISTHWYGFACFGIPYSFVAVWKTVTDFYDKPMQLGIDDVGCKITFVLESISN